MNDDAAKPTIPFQFNVLHILLGMAWVGATIALGRWLGHSVVSSISIFLAAIWLNAFGCFSSLQRPVALRLLASIALVLFVLSMFTPTMPKSFIVQPMPAVGAPTQPPPATGWEVAWITIEILMERDSIRSVLFYGAVSFANLLLPIYVVLTFFPFRSTTERKQTIANYVGRILVLLMGCNFATAMIVESLVGDFRYLPGLFVWLASFLIAATTVQFGKVLAILASVISITCLVWLCLGP